jgi:hypothetical protein
MLQSSLLNVRILCKGWRFRPKTETVDFFVFVGLWSQSADKLTIHSGFYKPTIPQSPPSHLQDYSTCNNARLEFSTIFVSSFDLKNGLHSGGLNPGPLGHESSALTTRPKKHKKLKLLILS